MSTSIRSPRAALVLAAALLAGVTGCGTAPSPELPAADGPAVATVAAAPFVAPEPLRKPAPSGAKASRATARLVFGGNALAVAAKYAGVPYAWGGTTPRGFDCSGFTRFVYAKFGKELPHSSAGQFRAVRNVGRQVQQGDLVFFHNRGHVDHVGIYAGDGLMWHAPNPQKDVRLDKISSQRKPWTAGRL